MFLALFLVLFLALSFLLRTGQPACDVSLVCFVHMCRPGRGRFYSRVCCDGGVTEGYWRFVGELEIASPPFACKKAAQLVAARRLRKRNTMSRAYGDLPHEVLDLPGNLPYISFSSGGTYGRETAGSIEAPGNPCHP